MNLKDKIHSSIESLNGSELAELSNYIDFLRYKGKNPEAVNMRNLLDHLRLYGICSWKELADAIRGSGVKSSNAGYLHREKAEKWLSLTYGLTDKLAGEVIRELFDMRLLYESWNGNIG
ncbi:hypothetical protein GCM10023188_27540 [Pontibacter saemangeumensis]|uniref:Uncharacterized protein n=1 Tax=Pontibacter saemangeumensis TaxID=1084525 RepID=A0ABP8LTV3_9BACT